MAQDAQQNSGPDRLETAEIADRQWGDEAAPATNPPAPQEQSPPVSARENDSPEKGQDPFKMAMEQEGKQKRTPGLKLFDAFLYPGLTNVGVFVISVVATYLTSHGDKMGGAFGKFMFNRGEWFKKKTMGMGMSENQADMAKMVTFSFLDGSLMAPFIKMFEDRREKIAHWIDKRLGKEPEDMSVYKAEPKQGWGSVLMGRFATAAVVVPTAVVLDKIRISDTSKPAALVEKWSKGKITGGGSMNDMLFNKPGLATGEKFVEKFPKFAEKHNRFDMPGLFKTGFFEAFYTSVCTAGLYVSSRFIARKTNEKNAAKEATPEQENPAAANAAAPRDEAQQDKPGAPQQQARRGEGEMAQTPARNGVETEWARKVGEESRQQPVSPQQKAGDWQSRSLKEDDSPARALS